jgi:His-Xaa-Ser system radical SAM maturase HxsC
MIPLQARTPVANWAPLSTDVLRVAGPREPVDRETAWHLKHGSRSGAALYLSDDPEQTGPGPTIFLPAALRHIDIGDVLIVPDDGQRLMVAWKNTATHNSLLLTERCDNYCIMCSQPPKERDDSYLYRRAKRIISLLPSSARSLGLTGGEPTTDPEAFLDLIEHCATDKPQLSVHVLSNGRKFADRAFTTRYGSIPLTDLMVGIPLYAAEPSLHDFVVQAPGAFNETVKGILNLAACGARIEVRVVVQHHTVPALADIATYIVRNLPFVDQVALMGLEMTGLARPNASIVWAEPNDYRDELRNAYGILQDGGVFTRIYNHPLCILDQELWPAAVQSISDWKNDFPEVCAPCEVKERCAGVFTTSGTRISKHLQPILGRETSVHRTPAAS